MKRSQAYTDAMAELRAVVMLQCHGRCWRCQRGWGLQLHHNGKRKAAGLFNETTSIMLCHDCHDWVTHHQTLWDAEVRARDPQFSDLCFLVRHTTLTKKPNPAAEYRRLRELRKKMESEEPQ